MLFVRVHTTHVSCYVTSDDAASIVGARLDFCNSLLYGTAEYHLDRLQRVQNQLACVVLLGSASATETRSQLSPISTTRFENSKFGIA